MSAPAGDRRYQIFDVFTDRPLAGNQLAVVHDADGLNDAAMQAIAREFNLSETVFVLPAERPAHSARIRIFTPARELPFAGHPTVGTAVALAQERFGTSGEQYAVVVLEEVVGIVRCGVQLLGGIGFAEFDCPKLPEPIAAEPDKVLIAAALGLAPAEIGFENHLPTVWTAGNGFDFVPVANRVVLAKAAPNPSAWPGAFSTDEVFLYTRDAEGHDHAFRARMFAPGMGIAEDPATGSAAAALAGPIHLFDAPPDGDHLHVIEQGFEMGRASLIHLSVAVARGVIERVRVGGHAVRIMEGRLRI